MRKWVINILLIIGFVAVLMVGSSLTAKWFRGSAQENVRPRGGVVKGRVVNPEWQPVAGAKVRAITDGPSRGIVPVAMTNENGEYELTIHQSGKYTIEGEKESDGYLRTLMSLDDGAIATAPQVEVHEGEVIQDVVVQLGTKAAVLTGRLVDASTNEPIKYAALTVRRADNPKVFTSVSLKLSPENGAFKALIPPLPVIIEIETRDYEKWSNNGASTIKQVNALHLRPGESKELTVSLRRKK